MSPSWFLIFAALGGVLLGHTPLLKGGELPSATNLDTVREQIEATRKSRDALKSVRNSLDKDLSELEKRYGKLVGAIEGLEVEEQEREKRITNLKRKRDALKLSIKKQQQVLERHLTSAYLIGRKDWLKLLMNQEDPSRLARVLAYYGYLGNARATLIVRWEHDMAAAEVAEVELAKESERQANVHDQLLHEKTQLAEAKQARHDLLRGWDREIKLEDDDLGRLEEDQRQLQDLLTSVDTANRPEMTATTPLESQVSRPVVRTGKAKCPPALGPIFARYGSPRAGGRWDGIVISGAEGSPIHAVAAGQIVYADWLRGYGLLLIVDHGEGLMSLYAFNQSLKKAVGESVDSGDVVASMGSSGGRSKPGLYFGIRKQGQAVDPVGWCSSKG